MFLRLCMCLSNLSKKNFLDAILFVNFSMPPYSRNSNISKQTAIGRNVEQHPSVDGVGNSISRKYKYVLNSFSVLNFYNP